MLLAGGKKAAVVSGSKLLWAWTKVLNLCNGHLFYIITAPSAKLRGIVRQEPDPERAQ